MRSHWSQSPSPLSYCGPAFISRVHGSWQGFHCRLFGEKSMLIGCSLLSLFSLDLFVWFLLAHAFALEPCLWPNLSSSDKTLFLMVSS